MYTRAVEAGAYSWKKVQEDFLRAIWMFDRNFAEGRADAGDNRNGRGDFFTDLVALLLENCSGKKLGSRGRVPGLIFPGHALDVCYPASGTVRVLIETKIAGAPRSAANPLQKHAMGRPGSSDLDKRVKEALFKTIDLKADWARREKHGAGLAGDLTTWLHRNEPHCSLFLAIRAVDKNDERRSIEFGNIASQVMDSVGLFVYGTTGSPATYEPLPVPPHLDVDRVLGRVCALLSEMS